jgi:hypothetical protein
VSAHVPGAGRPSPGIVTVARLDAASAWRRYGATDGTRPPDPAAGWVVLAERLADTDALDRWLRTERAATAAGHADLAGALIVYRLAGSLAELVVGPLLDQRRVVALAPDRFAVRFGDAARVDAVAVLGPEVAVLPDDPDAGRPGTTVVPDGDALRSAAVDSLVAVYEPLTAAVRPRAPFGLRGMWGTLADHVAEGALARARDRGDDGERAWAAADAVIDALAARVPLLRVRPRPERVVAGERRGLYATKGTCCLIYKAEPLDPALPAQVAAARRLAAAACISCPLRSDEDRRERYARHLAPAGG